MPTRGRGRGSDVIAREHHQCLLIGDRPDLIDERCDHSASQGALTGLPSGFNALPALLRAWRVEGGAKPGRGRVLPRKEVAERAGVSESWYRNLENGATVSLPAEVLTRLSTRIHRLTVDADRPRK